MLNRQQNKVKNIKLQAIETAKWSRTCWRGIELNHPPAWEITATTAGTTPARLIFSDRYSERLTVQWRKLNAMPDLKRVLDRQRNRDTTIEEATDLPSGWVGTVQPLDQESTPKQPEETKIEKKYSAETDKKGRKKTALTQSVITHLGRFFQEDGILIEVILSWPDSYDKSLEAVILESIKPIPANLKNVMWEGMGIRADVPKSYTIESIGSQNGLMEWNLSDTPKRILKIQRMALPDYWLKSSLSAWLKNEVAKEVDITNVRDIEFNGHKAVEIISRQRTALLKRLIGWRNYRVDIAWLCELENRVYRMQHTTSRHAGKAFIPHDMQIICCRKDVAVEGNLTDHVATRIIRKNSGIDLLKAVPYINRATKVTETAGGGVLASVPLKAAKRFAWLRWLLPISEERRVQLDELGSRTLKLCDGVRSVEQITERFAKDNKLTFREAQLSVAPFIRTLSERGIIAVVSST